MNECGKGEEGKRNEVMHSHANEVHLQMNLKWHRIAKTIWGAEGGLFYVQAGH